MSNGRKIIAGLEDAIAYVNGDDARGCRSTVSIPRHLDVRAIRQRLNMSQKQFAMQFGFSLSTLQNWEQGYRQPEGPARVLLTLIERIPEQVSKALTTIAA